MIYFCLYKINNLLDKINHGIDTQSKKKYR